MHHKSTASEIANKLYINVHEAIAYRFNQKRKMRPLFILLILILNKKPNNSLIILDL